MTSLELARRFMASCEAGDIDGATACFHEDAEIWHNFDGVTKTVGHDMAILKRIHEVTKSCRYDIRRLEEISSGYLQQHTLRLETKDGKKAETESVAVVTVEDGRIRRIEEYLNPAPLAALGL